MTAFFRRGSFLSFRTPRAAVRRSPSERRRGNRTFRISFRNLSRERRLVLILIGRLGRDDSGDAVDSVDHVVDVVRGQPHLVEYIVHRFDAELLGALEADALGDRLAVLAEPRHVDDSHALMAS